MKPEHISVIYPAKDNGEGKQYLCKRTNKPCTLINAYVTNESEYAYNERMVLLKNNRSGRLIVVEHKEFLKNFKEHEPTTATQRTLHS